MKELNPGLVTLHQYWVLADAVRYHGQRPNADDDGLPAELAELGKMASAFAMIRVWYALLYVVIEGYLELRLADGEIDALLADEDRVGALRRLRNSTFHYQKDPFTPKLWDYLLAPRSEHWIRDVNAAFKSYFERELDIAKFSETLKG